MHDALVEGIVVADDDLMERYLEGEVPSVEQLAEDARPGRGRRDRSSRWSAGRRSRRSPSTGWPRFICEIGPSPLDRPPVQVEAGGKTTEVAPDPAGPPLAWVWKTVVDRHVGKISLFKVLSGPHQAGRRPRQRPDPRRRAHPRPLHPAGQGAAAGPGAAGRRPGRRRQARRRRHRGHPGAQGNARWSIPAAASCPSRRCGSASVPSRRATRTS